MKKLGLKTLILVSGACIAIMPAFLISSNGNVVASKLEKKFYQKNEDEDIDNVFKRFKADVKSYHDQYLNSYLDFWNKQNRKDVIEQMCCDLRAHTSDFMHWEEEEKPFIVLARDIQLGLRDLDGNYFRDNNARPRIISNQNIPTSLTRGIVTGWDVNKPTPDISHFSGPGLVHEHQPWGPMCSWVDNNHNMGDLQNHLDDIFKVTREKRANAYDIIDVDMNFADPNAIDSAKIIRGDGDHDGDHWNWFKSKHNSADSALLNLIWQKRFDGGAGGHGEAWVYPEAYRAESRHFNIKQVMFGYDNALKVNDFGYDSDKGYWYQIGFNKVFLAAAEGEKQNHTTSEQWIAERDAKTGDRVLWIDPKDVPFQPEGTYVAQRDAIFSEVNKYINNRTITYDNYKTVRKWLHDKCKVNQRIIDIKVFQEEMEQNVELHNSGWPKWSQQYGIVNCPDLWDLLVMILPSTKYSIEHCSNGQEDARGAWGDIIYQEPKDFNLLADENNVGNRVYVGKPKEDQGYAFQTNCNILTNKQDPNNPLHIDTWDGKFKIDSEGRKVDNDINLTSYTPAELNFIFRGTLQINIDPNQHSGKRGVQETYFHVGPNFEKLCAVENLKKLHISINKKQTPTSAWMEAKKQGSSIEEHLKSMVADEDGNPSPLFAYKKLNGELDANLPDNMLQVIPHNNQGTIEVRLYDPQEKYVAWSTILSGFEKDESSSNINFEFKTPYVIGTNKTSPVLNVSSACSIENTTLTYESSDVNLVEVIDVADKGYSFKLRAKGQKGEASITTRLWYPDGTTLVDLAIFKVKVFPTPESIKIVSHPDLHQTVTAKDYAKGQLKDPFVASVEPAGTGDATFELQNAQGQIKPEWLKIDAATGIISWENAKEGNYKFLVVAKASADLSLMDSIEMTMSFVPTPAEQITISIQASEGGVVVTNSLKINKGMKFGQIKNQLLNCIKANESYTFDKWVDSQGQEIKDDYVINSDLVVKAIFKNQSAPPEQKDKLPAIVGGSVAGVAGVLAITGFSIFAYKRRKIKVKKPKEKKDANAK